MGGANGLRKGYHDLLRREILELIPSTSKSILDLGCGAGNLGKALKKRQHCIVHGIELSSEAAEIAGKNLDHIWCDNLNRFDPKFIKQKYDTLIFADILEHLVSPWRTLKKFTSLLTENGTIIASIPNIAHPWILSNLKQGVFRYEPAGILDITHLRFFTKTSLCQLFCGAGLKIVNIRPYPSAENPMQYHITAVKAPVEVKKPLVTILILTFNEWKLTKQCIKSIKKNTQEPYKILVIDNGSTDETVEELRKDKTVLHIENSVNLGFGKGFNIGLMLVDTPYFVLANNDTVVTDGWFSRMKYNIDSDKALVVLGPRSNYVSGPQLVKDVPYKGEKSLEAFAKVYRCGCARAVTYFPRIVFFFTLFKTEVLTKIGYFDEIFGKGNYEDDDYCLRVAVKGLKCGYDNTTFVHHHGSITYKKLAVTYPTLLATNRKKFMEKWHLTEYYGTKL